jgi:hypothetical protein
VTGYDICVTTAGEVTASFDQAGCAVFEYTEAVTFTAALEVGSVYYWGVRAVNKEGVTSFWQGRSSTGAVVKSDLTRPSTPTGVTLVIVTIQLPGASAVNVTVE